jgi:hypothetical protein
MSKINQILQLPEGYLVNKKITKAFFKRNFDLTLSERKLLEDADIIQQIDWVASIKPQNSNISSYSDELRSFEEVQVISVTIGGKSELSKYAPRVIELIQKYIPYAVFLVVLNDECAVFNTTEKRINLNDATKRTKERSLSTDMIRLEKPTAEQQAFLSSCAFEKLEKANLQALYLSYTASIASLQAAKLTGEFVNRPIERIEADVKLMEEIDRIEAEIIQLANLAKKETQLNTQVQLNTEVQLRRKKLETLKANLK